ncbi:MAG: MFS transporter [Sphingobium sp.]
MASPALAPLSGLKPVTRLQAWGTVALLFLASIVSVIDRTILNVVVDSVKAELAINDIQISLLQGIAFGLFYATMGVWLGLVADRTARRNLIIGGIALWSIATIGGGLAHNFGSLFLFRMLVGLGEAALSPAAISLIADLFPEGKRGRPIGIFLMGQALANGISISVTGALLAAAARGDLAHIPFFADLSAWRIVFLVCGVAGLFVSAAFLLTREPPRERKTASANLGAQAAQAFRYFRQERGQYLGIYLGFAVFFLGAYGAGVWQIAMISRKFGLSAATVAAMFGPLAIGFGLAGPLIGGFIVDAIVRRRGTAGLPWLLAVTPLLVIPSAMAVMAPTPLLAAISCASQSGIAAIIGSATLAYLQSSVPPEMRGISVSLTGLLNTLIGSALGPTLVAVLTDKLFADPAMVGWGIFWVSVPAYLVSALLYATVALRIRRRARTSEVPAHV